MPAKALAVLRGTGYISLPRRRSIRMRIGDDMNSRCLRRTESLILALLIGCTQQNAPNAESPRLATAAQQSTKKEPSESAKPVRAKVYDESADGFEQIATALALAKQDNKRVVLQFGAEWCGWCHRLHRLFETDDRIAKKLKTDFVVVLIDVNGDHNKAVDEKYGHPMQHGLPVIVVLDADGTQLTTQDTADLEEGDHHDPTKVMAFLDKWSPQS